MPPITTVRENKTSVPAVILRAMSPRCMVSSLGVKRVSISFENIKIGIQSNNINIEFIIKSSLAEEDAQYSQIWTQENMLRK